MWDLGHLTTLSGEADTRFALIIRGAGLGLLFTPINLAAFSSLKGIEIAQGASLLNLCRQLGGSFGIAVLSTYLTNMAAYHRNNLVGHLYPWNPAVVQRLGMLTNAFIAKGNDAVAARKMALAALDRTVQVQASTMSFNDAFLLIGMAVLLVSPAIFLLRKPQQSGPPTAAMEH
jgi:DHA2 family multidrug resistance protein